MHTNKILKQHILKWASFMNREFSHNQKEHKTLHKNIIKKIIQNLYLYQILALWQRFLHNLNVSQSKDTLKNSAKKESKNNKQPQKNKFYHLISKRKINNKSQKKHKIIYWKKTG